MEQVELALETGEPYLTPDQISVVNECMGKKVFGLSLHMGSGKTVISLITALKKKLQQKIDEPILVINDYINF